MTIAGLNLLVIRAHDIEASREFYEQIGLGFEAEQHGKGPEHYAANLGSVVFEIYPQQDYPPTKGVRLGFIVPELDAVMERFDDVSIVTVARQTPWGYAALLRDPDDHKVELTQANLAP